MSTVTIGVCVYNEEKNIANLLNSLLSQKTTEPIKEIIVVSSACSDKTDEIIENDFVKYNPRIFLIKQGKREGKASAINIFLKYASGDIVVLESGDTIPAEGAIEDLTDAFNDPKIGMAGGRPVPINDPDTFMGFTAHLVWNLHHKIALEHPKLGEMVAFRRDLIRKIPTNTAVDEAFIEALINGQGYELKYVPDAVVYNKGPETVSDFLKQRRRIFAGHIHLRKTKGYAPSSMNKLKIVTLVFKDLKFAPKQIVWTFGATLLEFYGRLLGSYDFYIKRENPFIWNIAETTKGNIQETTKSYAPNAIPVAQHIKLWSMVRRQTSFFLKSKTQPTASFLPETSASISVKPGIIPTTPALTKSQQDLTTEKMQELKNPSKILIKLIPLVPIIIIGNGLSDGLFELFFS
ncbi:MAG: glycosyltransferase [Candidatus Methanoperedens sp.]|nr:glycosyltransferase [Candidatus Methanoperedens sp.]